ncbi:hypothetical protein G4B88_002113 [Cannabis sativa]|uniref:Uncharacterized protein n=1 Tax=Cannabis sativa TaxID=3483 RepID=A0A7J6EYF7_CANSA|nr:hypothetical protein G4B88_002113 [Cannabis sativa]
MRRGSSSSGSGGSKTTPCCSKVGIKRGPWTAEEDEVLCEFIRKEGEGRWRTLPKRAGLLRCGKSCRLRWMNYLRPSVKRGHIQPDEEDLILRLHRLLGNRTNNDQEINEDDHHDVNLLYSCSHDDVLFSSFLNSIINEDAFLSSNNDQDHHHEQQQQQQQLLLPNHHHDDHEDPSLLFPVNNNNNSSSPNGAGFCFDQPK